MTFLVRLHRWLPGLCVSVLTGQRRSCHQKKLTWLRKTQVPVVHYHARSTLAWFSAWSERGNHDLSLQKEAELLGIVDRTK